LADAMGIERAESISRLGELYQAHVGRAVALATLLTGDRSVAEDVAHDAFVRVAGRFGELRDPNAFGAYLRRTVVNLCHTRARRAGRELEASQRRSQLEATTPDTSAEDRDELWPLMKALPYRQRAALVLRYWDDLSEAQIGEVLRCSPRAVNALLSRAREALRNELGRSEA
jgi:RNA polymerase sigma factor (sigma-70 family)